MIGYPFDSQITYDEHGNPGYDRGVSSKPLKSLIQKLFTTGVMPNPSNNLQVMAGSEGMTVIVKAGFCVIEGGLKLEEEDHTLVLQAADTTNPRIDTVVMRWDGNDDVRACDPYVVKGTAAASPVRPDLTRVGSIYEIGLADIFIPSNSSVVTQERITDTRYETARCGIVSSVSEWDTTTIYTQVQSDLADFKATEQADFLAWYETIKDIIDESTAGRLQAEIDDLDERVTDLEGVDISGKADKVNGATNGHLAGLDANGNLTDSGVAASDVHTGTLPVSKGGTGATTLASGAALIGNGTGAVQTRAITNNTSKATAPAGSTNLATMNSLLYGMQNYNNRASAVNAADANYTTVMARGIYATTTDLTAGSTALTNGVIALVYE